tara:strand:- start:158 stop:346 length:189 start_codon:yes stop_codon:yes gene_type:complete
MKFTFKRKEYEHLCSVVGSLCISQFKEQNEYRVVIDQIFQSFLIVPNEYKTSQEEENETRRI